MHRSAVIGTTALAALSMLAWTSPAAAAGIGGAQVTRESIEAHVAWDGTSPNTPAANNQPPKEVCNTYRINPIMEGLFITDKNGRLQPLFDEQHKETEGSWYRKVCYIETTRSSYDVYWGANVDATDLAKQALGSALLPTPVIAISPTLPAITLVNYPQWLWIDSAAWRTVTASASAGGLTATVTAVPYQVAWDSGDTRANGDDRYLSCNGPGKALPQNAGFLERKAGSGCTFYYTHTSGHEPGLAFPLSATILWRVTWTATNGTSGDLGVVSRNSSIPIKVGEYQVVNINPPKGP